MATTIDTFIGNILTAATSLGLESTAAIEAGKVLAEQAPNDVAASNIVYPSAGDVSELTGLVEPVNADIVTKLNEMIAEIAALYGTYFPNYADEVSVLTDTAAQLGGFLTNDGYLTRDVVSELQLEVNEQNEQDRLLYDKLAQDYARRGFQIAPGMLLRDTTDTYQTKARQMLGKKFGLIEGAVDDVAQQHKLILQELFVTANKSRATAINASATLISAAARHSAFPSRNYAALVDVKAAMADALLAKYSADKVLNERLLRVYAGNLEVKSAIDRYNANMHQVQVGNITGLAVAKAENIGKEAGALWNAINVIASASTISFE